MHSKKTNLEPLRKFFKENGKEFRFQIGQSVCQEKYLPGQIYLIKSGTARLLTTHNGNLTTLDKFGPDSFIGVASLLRGKSCEEVRAAKDLVVWSISDTKFKQLYTINKEVRNCCDSNLWEAEIIFFIKKYMLDGPYKNQFSIQDCYNQAKNHAKVVLPNESDLNKALAQEQILFIGSHHYNSSFGIELKSTKKLQEIQAVETSFPLRIVSFPARVMISNGENFNEESLGSSENNLEKGVFKSVPVGPSSPPVSSLSKSKITEKLLVKGEGTILGIIACFQMLSTLMKFPFRRDAVEKMLKEFTKNNRAPSLRLCGQIASNHGLQVAISRVKAQMGLRLKTPSLIPWKGNFAIVIESNQDGITIASPSEGYLTIKSNQLEEFFTEGIEILLLEKSNFTPKKLFGPSWFWPALRSHQGVLLQVLLAGFVVQLFTLANPLLIQVIIDKVITQRSLDTLQVLGIALLLVTLMEGVLGSLKTFLLSETTNRIDQRLGAEVIDHLLRLPLNYFDRRPTGELSSRISELEKIRTFLTSQAFTTILDAAFSVIYVVVMLLYSVTLTLISLLVLPIQIGLTLIGAPLFRRQFRNVAEANAKTQSHLVEVLTGIETVKAQNVEINSRWKWQELYGLYINRSFEKTISGTTLNQLSQVLQKISQLLVLWVGATMVLRGEMTLGQLIAFRIISGYVTQPLLRLSTIWQGLQELKVSFERLADVIDTPKESNEVEKTKLIMPPIEGFVTFEAVDFSFVKGSRPILQNINLSIPAHQFIGIVGQSGSGKSTLMKLLPRLYLPENGRILVDGVDVKKVELDSLRRQIGIVPQEPLLFTGTISENISLAQPEASNDDIVKAAKLANAHDFIMELPDGYSTEVKERGSSLSGGQRQRITIARTLLGNPKLLILDEATSSLDYESEQKVCSNLLNELNECTVFFITHRLATVRRANIIIMMHQGTIEEIGTHDELMVNQGRYYALYRQQEWS
ncbi:ABC transporter transmembrane domain-containing protein [Prochlorococcus sp. MIT 1307]|uniref:ABC transporter transmembrane domain-containing protein n=1 Tax=Prochlorococcus sp. MIT 1307 TaxID=3096219 RepID=UPI002A761EFF|nr:ABC transporter transmembrane domain-containing protein [Prochlorococcus sp. MIT 1307]